MLIPYEYDAGLQDLWLYEPHTITYTGGLESTNLLRPYAWNPDGELYGYRKSLEGLTAKYRTHSTSPAVEAKAPYLPFNPDTVENRPAYRNSYPPSSTLISSRLVRLCSHCYGGQRTRDVSVDFTTYRGGDTYLNAADPHRWIRHDDTIVELPNDDVSRPYHWDTSFSPEADPLLGFDNMIVETDYPVDVTPVRVTYGVHARMNQKAWMIDGSMKIIPCRTGISGVLNGVYMQNHGRYEINGLFPNAYTHDSGSTFWVEVSPPTSREAGDGVLAVLPYHLVSGSDFLWRGIWDFTFEGFLQYTKISLPRADFHDWLAYVGLPPVEFLNASSIRYSNTPWDVLSNESLNEFRDAVIQVEGVV